jgi:hypothetical protein
MYCFISCISQSIITVNRLHIENVKPLKFNILDLFLYANKLERENISSQVLPKDIQLELLLFGFFSMYIYDNKDLTFCIPFRR